jgi:hypothetical protein
MKTDPTVGSSLANPRSGGNIVVIRSIRVATVAADRQALRMLR